MNITTTSRKSIRSLISKTEAFSEATLELTSTCNFQCYHCYHDVRWKEMTFPEIKIIVDSLHSLGVIYVTLTGGEALLHPDFSDTYTYLKKKGFVVGLFTNGTLIAKYADLLRDMPPEMVHISLYGTNEDEYRELTGVSGHFELVINSLDLFNTLPIPFELRVIITNLNYSSVIAGHYDQLASRYCANVRYSAHLYGLRSGSPYPTHLRLSHQQLAHLHEQGILGSRKKKETKTDLTAAGGGCPAGDSSLNVYSDGQFSLCAMDVEGRTYLCDGIATQLKKRKGILIEKFSLTPCAECSVNNDCICCQIEYLNSDRTHLCEVQKYLRENNHG